MKFQNPSLNFFLNGRKDARTHKPKPICSPLFQSWVHKNLPSNLQEMNVNADNQVTARAAIMVLPKVEITA